MGHKIIHFSVNDILQNNFLNILIFLFFKVKLD